MNLANFRTDRNGNPYGLKKCKYHCDYGDGEYYHYKEIDGCVHNKIKEEKDDKHRKVGEESMGCVDTITAYNFPKQSEYVNRRCKVCFHYNTTKFIMGTVIRDDREEPYETLIKLDDGRVLRAAECQYSFSI